MCPVSLWISLHLLNLGISSIQNNIPWEISLNSSTKTHPNNSFHYSQLCHLDIWITTSCKHIQAPQRMLGISPRLRTTNGAPSPGDWWINPSIWIKQCFFPYKQTPFEWEQTDERQRHYSNRSRCPHRAWPLNLFDPKGLHPDRGKRRLWWLTVGIFFSKTSGWSETCSWERTNHGDQW